MALNSVHLFVRDATGQTYLSMFTANTPDNIAKFRTHVAFWKRYVCTQAGRKAYNGAHVGPPVFPVEIVVEEYHDKSQK